MTPSTPSDGPTSAPAGGVVETPGSRGEGAGPRTTRARHWLHHHWLRHLLGLAVVLGVLMAVATPAPMTPAPITTPRLVVVGVGERDPLTPVDRQVLDTYARSAAYGVVATDRYVGECVSAAWLTLGMGQLAHTGDQCDPQVTLSPDVRLGRDGAAAVANWAQLRSLNRSYGVDLTRSATRISAVGGTPDTCVAAVGPGAALAAADADGAVAHYSELTAWQAGGYASPCRVTVVDAGVASDEVIRHLADQQKVTVLVVGLGTAGPLPSGGLGIGWANRVKLSSVQLAYRVQPVGDVPVGALTSRTTREPGVISLGDVSAAIVDFLHRPGTSGQRTAAGAPLGVVPGPVSAALATALVGTVTVLQHRQPIMLTFGALAVALLIVVAVMVLRRRWSHAPLVGAALTTWPVALLSGGVVPWYASGHPVAAGIGTVLGAWVLATLVARLLVTPRRPAGIAGAALALTATAASAALGDAWQWGTLLDSTTAFGPDWVGIGPGAAAICVGSALTLAAWWADRLPRRQSIIAIVGLVLLVDLVLLPAVTYAVALLCGGVVLLFADTARDWVRAAIPWADPLFSGGAVASLVAALVGTAVLLIGQGALLLHTAPEAPLFGGILMGWLAAVTLAVWLELRAAAWFAAHDFGLLPDPLAL